jgi:glycosyltransferase involved in cell wall biosynthesis
LALMKILHISYSDSGGGAARAAYRIHRALIDAGLVSRMWVQRKLSDDWTVEGRHGPGHRVIVSARGVLGAYPASFLPTTSTAPHSFNMLPSRWAQAINRSDADVVNLHWVNAEMMSIEDIGRIRKPLVWTLHDMWAFCGGEHLASDGPEVRWRHGYNSADGPVRYRGVDMDRWTWERKRRAWRKPMHIVCPSNWLARCARDSTLMHEWSVSAVPHTLDLGVFKPQDRGFCRAALNLPADRRIVLFGANACRDDPNKGYDLLLGGLRHLAAASARAQQILCVIFGQSEPYPPSELPVSTRWMGFLHDDVTLALLYASADVMVVPSRQENFVQTGMEAQACGCPVVAFDSTGNRDVVQHLATGYLAKPFEVEDLARGIAYVLGDHARGIELGNAARERAERLWSPSTVIPQYLKVYWAAIDARNCNKSGDQKPRRRRARTREAHSVVADDAQRRDDYEWMLP